MAGAELFSLFQPLALACQEVRLYYVDIAAVPREGWPQLAGCLGAEDWQDMQRVSAEARRQELLLSRGLLRVWLGHGLGMAPAAVPLVRQAGGKWSLPGHRLHFNVSHSGGVWVCALGEGVAVGVDVEQVRPLPRLERLVARYATPAERQHWQTGGLGERGFLQLWVAKEAYAKALGTGLRGLLGRLRELDTSQPGAMGLPGGWQAQWEGFSLGQNYVGAVCWGVIPG